jgi:hypothetical protein
MTPPDGCDNPTVSSSPALQQWIVDNGHRSEMGWDVTPTPRLTAGRGEDTAKIRWGEGCDATRHFDCISFINWCIMRTRSPASKPFTFDIPQYFYSIEPKAGTLSAIEVTDPNDVLPADILIYGKIVKPASSFFEDEIKKEIAAGDTKGAAADQIDLDLIRGKGAHDFIFRHSVPCVPTFGVGVGLHHIGFATGNGTERVHAKDSANGVVVDVWEDPARRIRLPDSVFF